MSAFAWPLAAGRTLGYPVDIAGVDWVDWVGVNGEVPVQVDGTVPATRRIPLLVEAEHEKCANGQVHWDQKTGRSNQTNRLKAKV